MAWRYLQSTGWLFGPDGHLLARGYSGKGEGKNQAAFAMLKNVGPIPVGTYTMGEPRDTAKHGPLFIPLIPDAGTAMLGRSGFGVHGDSLKNPGDASEGCIILPRHVREAMAASADRVLIVDAQPEGLNA